MHLYATTGTTKPGVHFLAPCRMICSCSMKLRFLAILILECPVGVNAQEGKAALKAQTVVCVRCHVYIAPDATITNSSKYI